jgi:hypothetical protein
MVSWGNWKPTENCFLTAYHPSFMLCWWVLTAGSLWPVQLVYKSILGVPPFHYSLSNSRASSPPEIMIPFWQTLIFCCTNWQIHSIPPDVNNTTLLETCSMVTNDGRSIPCGWIIVVLGFVFSKPYILRIQKLKGYWMNVCSRDNSLLLQGDLWQIFIFMS